jgi:NAD(P)-dependent dehydrogenase (short-subunit alcohol dehydrogenase family)
MGEQPWVMVTGARGALGAEVVRAFAEAGYRVVEADRALKETHAGLSVAMDVRDPKSVRETFESLDRRRISLDALVHCAGGFRFAMHEGLSDEDARFLLETNLLSAFWISREAFSRMKAHKRGAILFVGSRATQDAPAGMGAYCASKAGLNALTQSLAKEGLEYGVRVNCVQPSIIDTPANRQAMGTKDAEKWVKPEALAQICLKLCTEWADPITGALLPVGGKV